MPAVQTSRSSPVYSLKTLPRAVPGLEQALLRAECDTRAADLKALIDALQQRQQGWLRDLEEREASVIERETTLRAQELHERALAERERRIQKLERVLEVLRERVDARMAQLDERKGACLGSDFTQGSYPNESEWWAMQFGKKPERAASAS